MALPIIPLQNGKNLPGLDTDEKIKQGEDQDQEVDDLNEALGLDDEDDSTEEELIELDDGSVVVNYKQTKSPNQNPEFYVNLAEEFEEDLLDTLADQYLEYIDIDREARKERDKQYEDGKIAQAEAAPLRAVAFVDDANLT